MEGTRLDAVVRSLTGVSSRRCLISGASATALVLAATRFTSNVEAKKKDKKSKRKKKNNTGPSQPQPQTPVTAVAKADAVCPGPVNDAFGIVDVSSRLAQTFTAIASGPLVRAELRLTEPAGSLGDYILRLSPVNAAGIPTNGVLAETTVLDANVPSGLSTVTFTFATPASVVAGTSYALVVTRPGTDQLVWAGRTGNPCSGTAYVSPTEADPFLAVGNIDFAFETFVIA